MDSSPVATYVRSIDLGHLKNCCKVDPKTTEMIALRYGFRDGKRYSYKEVGARYGLSKRRAKQIVLAGIESYDAVRYTEVPQQYKKYKPDPQDLFAPIAL